MDNKDSHNAAQWTETVEADVPHRGVAKLAENPVARRYARSLGRPDGYPHG